MPLDLMPERPIRTQISVWENNTSPTQPKMNVCVECASTTYEQAIPFIHLLFRQTYQDVAKWKRQH